MLIHHAPKFYNTFNPLVSKPLFLNYYYYLSDLRFWFEQSFLSLICLNVALISLIVFVFIPFLFQLFLCILCYFHFSFYSSWRQVDGHGSQQIPDGAQVCQLVGADQTALNVPRQEEPLVGLDTTVQQP